MSNLLVCGTFARTTCWPANQRKGLVDYCIFCLSISILFFTAFTCRCRCTNNVKGRIFGCLHIVLIPKCTPKMKVLIGLVDFVTNFESLGFVVGWIGVWWGGGGGRCDDNLIQL